MPCWMRSTTSTHHKPIIQHLSRRGEPNGSPLLLKAAPAVPTQSPPLLRAALGGHQHPGIRQRFGLGALDQVAREVDLGAGGLGEAGGDERASRRCCKARR